MVGTDNCWNHKVNTPIRSCYCKVQCMSSALASKAKLLISGNHSNWLRIITLERNLRGHAIQSVFRAQFSIFGYLASLWRPMWKNQASGQERIWQQIQLRRILWKELGTQHWIYFFTGWQGLILYAEQVCKRHFAWVWCQGTPLSKWWLLICWFHFSFAPTTEGGICHSCYEDRNSTGIFPRHSKSNLQLLPENPVRIKAYSTNLPIQWECKSI